MPRSPKVLADPRLDEALCLHQVVGCDHRARCQAVTLGRVAHRRQTHARPEAAAAHTLSEQHEHDPLRPVTLSERSLLLLSLVRLLGSEQLAVMLD